MAEAPKVATDILPVHGLVSRVMDGVGAPDVILPPGASPHGHSMRPSEAAALESADIVFWVGPALTNWLEKPINVLAADAPKIALISTPGTVLREAVEDAHDHGDAKHDEEGHEDAHDHDDHDKHDHDDHGHDGIDPHAWLDPENARVWIAAIADALSKLDPENAAAYAANAKAADAELATLIAELRQDLASVEPASFAVFHDALGYFEDRFDLGPSIALLSSDAEKPSPRRIADVRSRVQEAGVGKIFGDSQADEALINTVFEGGNVIFCKVDFLGNEIAPGPNHYRQLLQSLSAKIVGCGRN